MIRDKIIKNKIGLYEFAKGKIGKLTQRSLGISTNTLKYICRGNYIYKVSTKGYKGIRPYVPNQKSLDVLCKKLDIDMDTLNILINNSRDSYKAMQEI